MSVGWHFPPSHGGTRHGFNDSGIETYAGAPYDGLAREIIQNSLDAPATTADQPVTVEFDFIEIAREDFPGADELLEAMEKCLRESRDSDKAKAFFKNAVQELKNARIPCLKISDSGTTGLCGDYRQGKGQWFAITKGSGISEKVDTTAGGSFGIGKNAPYVLSSLRTVFYSTLYKESGHRVCRWQGKSILISHATVDGGYTQGTGFYGETDNCMPIEGNNLDIIPEIFRPKEQGCVVFVPGFSIEKDWRYKIMGTVASSFFCAIDQNKLQVLIQDENDKITLIDQNSLEQCFQEVIDFESAIGEKIESEKTEISRHYYRAMKTKSRDGELSRLGHCKIWVRVGEGLPKQVALLRKNGMLITDDQQGLKRWRGRSDFIGVFMCESDKGNKLLRDMENPRHNAFQPDRAIPDQREEATKALKELVEWIRECVDDLAKPEETESTELDELNEFFPDFDTPETLPGDEGERNVEGRPVYSPKPLKRAKSPINEDLFDDEDNEGGAGEGGGGGGSTDGHGPNEGDGTGGTGSRSFTRTTADATIENVRVVPNDAKGKKKTIYFTPRLDGNIRIELFVMGDDGHMEPVLTSGADRFLLVKNGQRVSHKVKLRYPVTDSIAVRACQEISKNT